MAPSNTQKHARAPVAITRSAANDIAAVLIKHNPAAPKADIETTVRAVVADFEDRHETPAPAAVSGFVLPAEEVVQAFVDRASRQASSRTANKRLIDVAAEAPVEEESQGEGFGELLPAEEGRKRVAAYATPVRLEDWAGSVAGPGRIRAGFRNEAFDTARLAETSRHHRLPEGVGSGLPAGQFIDGHTMSKAWIPQSHSPIPRVALADKAASDGRQNSAPRAPEAGANPRGRRRSRTRLRLVREAGS